MLQVMKHPESGSRSACWSFLSLSFGTPRHFQLRYPTTTVLPETAELSTVVGSPPLENVPKTMLHCWSPSLLIGPFFSSFGCPPCNLLLCTIPNRHARPNTMSSLPSTLCCWSNRLSKRAPLSLPRPLPSTFNAFQLHVYHSIVRTSTFSIHSP